MAKITKQTVMILGELFDLPINCSAEGQFYTVFPLQFRAIGKLPRSYSSKPELETEIRRFVKEVNEATKTVSYIIAYRLSNQISYSASSSPAAVLTLSWQAYKVETTGNRKTYHTVKRSHEGYTPPVERQVCEGFESGSYVTFGYSVIVNPEKDPTIPFSPKAYEFF